MADVADGTEVVLDMSRGSLVDVAEGAKVLGPVLDGFNYEKYDKIYKSDSITSNHSELQLHVSEQRLPESSGDRVR